MRGVGFSLSICICICICMLGPTQPKDTAPSTQHPNSRTTHTQHTQPRGTPPLLLREPGDGHWHWALGVGAWLCVLLLPVACAVCVLWCVGFVIVMACAACCCCACCCCSPCCASAVQQNRKAPQAEYRKFAVVLSLATAKPQRIDAQGANISLQLLPNNLPSYGRVRWFNFSDLVGAPCSRNANQPERERIFLFSSASNGPTELHFNNSGRLQQGL